MFLVSSEPARACRAEASHRDDHGWIMAAYDVLVVDDETEGRDALAQVLVAHGHTVRQAADGRIALAMMAERMPGVLILDLEMPVMSGWEVIAFLRGAGALDSMTVVVLSAATAPPVGARFVRKPCAVDDLFDAIRTEEPRARGSSLAQHP